MCTKMFRVYTCGCTKNEQFRQCDERLGTNVICTRIVRHPLDPSAHMCRAHMVKEGKDEMRRV